MNLGRRAIGLFALRWSIANAIGFALGGVVASLAFPLMFAGALFAGVMSFAVFGSLPWKVFGFLFLWVPSGIVVGCLTGYLIAGFAGVAQEEVLIRKLPVISKWARRSMKGGLLGGAVAGGLVLLLTAIAALLDSADPTFPFSDNTLPGTSTGAFFPVNWLFRRSLPNLIVLGFAGTMTGLFVGWRQRRIVAIENSLTPDWPYWSAIGWGLGWAIASVLSESLLKVVGLGAVANAEATYRSFESWPLQLASAALSLAICGAVYGVATAAPVVTVVEGMSKEGGQ
jgi:hypothetical protein